MTHDDNDNVNNNGDVDYDMDEINYELTKEMWIRCESPLRVGKSDCTTLLMMTRYEH